MPSAASQWQIHRTAFDARDVELILQGFADLSMITVYNHITGKKSVFRGLAGVRKCYTDFFQSLSDRSDFAILSQAVNEAHLGEPGNICFIWNCLASGFCQVAETLILDGESKILYQNIVISFHDPNGSSVVDLTRDSEALRLRCDPRQLGWLQLSARRTER